MTREETKKAIEVMQHFENGGEVQILVYDYGGRQEWEDCPNPDWDWDYHTYRKKPQPMKVTEEEKEIISKGFIAVHRWFPGVGESVELNFEVVPAMSINIHDAVLKLP